MEVLRSPAGYRRSRPRCHFSASEPDKNRKKKEGRRSDYSCAAPACLCHFRSTYPPLSESTLQFRQLGCGTPGLSDQAFLCDRRAAEVQHHLDRLTLLHAHLPLRQDGHRSHQQLLQVRLGLRKHLRQREVKVVF